MAYFGTYEDNSGLKSQPTEACSLFPGLFLAG